MERGNCSRLWFGRRSMFQKLLMAIVATKAAANGLVGSVSSALSSHRRDPQEENRNRAEQE